MEQESYNLLAPFSKYLLPEDCRPKPPKFLMDPMDPDEVLQAVLEEHSILIAEAKKVCGLNGEVTIGSSSGLNKHAPHFFMYCNLPNSFMYWGSKSEEWLHANDWGDQRNPYWSAADLRIQVRKALLALIKQFPKRT